MVACELGSDTLAHESDRPLAFRGAQPRLPEVAEDVLDAGDVNLTLHLLAHLVRSSEQDHALVTVERAVELGATVQGPIVTDEQGRFQVLLDPEGNELCLVD